jgi:hypothetical protein
MVKLLFSVLLEAGVGISLAGVLLAIAVPVVNRYRPTTVEDSTTAVIIGAVIAGVTAMVLFRPGSAINRWRRRSIP